MTAESLPIRDGFLARLIVAAGQKLVPRRVQGHLILTLPSGRQFELGRMSSGPSAEIHLKSWQPVWASVRRASVGFCESYMEGHWESPDPARVIGFYLQNRDSLDRAARPIFFRSAIDRFRHVLRNNSVKGSRRNIEAHYDLGNDFYRLWLDETMTYSSAWFCAGAVELADAQRAKYRLVLETLGLRPDHSLLEIGCGWGGLAEEAMRLGAAVTGITLSTEQLVHARARLGDGADIRLQDYRDAEGSFDRIASIEMIEAVGESHWGRYFGVLSRRLKPGGVAVLQAITIDERHFDGYRAGADFIQRHIFPGGMLPTREVIRKHARAAGLDYEHVIGFGNDYARTLAMWREAFEAQWPAIANLGFDERFHRKWRLYLDYCEAGFRHNAIDVGLFRLTKPGLQ